MIIKLLQGVGLVALALLVMAWGSIFREAPGANLVASLVIMLVIGLPYAAATGLHAWWKRRYAR